MPSQASLAFTQAKLDPAIAPERTVVDNVPLASGTYTHGTVMGQQTSGGKWAAYGSGNSDGTQTARALLVYDATSDGTNVTLGSGTEWAQTYPTAPAYIGGYFACEDLTGLDSTAVGQLGHLVRGNTTSGILRVE